DRPVLLLLTCLHEAYPQQQHPTPYPFGSPKSDQERPKSKVQSPKSEERPKSKVQSPKSEEATGDGEQKSEQENSVQDETTLDFGLWTLDSSKISEDLAKSLIEQKRRFEGLVERMVPLDLTRPEEGFAEPNYGGEFLKQTLLDVLPAAYRQSLLALNEA